MGSRRQTKSPIMSFCVLWWQCEALALVVVLDCVAALCRDGRVVQAAPRPLPIRAADVVMARLPRRFYKLAFRLALARRLPVNLRVVLVPSSLAVPKRAP